MSGSFCCAQRETDGSDNHWVVKLAQGSRSSDVCLTDDALTVVAYRCAKTLS